ncbi:unnamed protein product [Pedinophyceae sp. YPF-701]|nr:unnamed protein product [Pedinophyceae sp. YPF-701]
MAAAARVYGAAFEVMQRKFGTVRMYLREHRNSDHDSERCMGWLIQEYSSLPHTMGAPKHSESVSQANSQHNRYSNVLAYDYNRVKLRPPAREYINANHITSDASDGIGPPFHYVACQGPIPSTVSDMLHMVVQLKSPIVIMLARNREGGREKCAQYLPERGARFGVIAGFRVDVGSEYTPLKGMYVRDLEITPPGGAEPHRTRHIAFDAWPDFGVPADSSVLRAIQEEVRKAVPLPRGGQKPGPPAVVHCSAGIGRSGSFLAVDIALRRLDFLAREGGDVDVRRIEAALDVRETVTMLRGMRCGCVQGLEQYCFIYNSVLEGVMERAGVKGM